MGDFLDLTDCFKVCGHRPWWGGIRILHQENQDKIGLWHARHARASRGHGKALKERCNSHGESRYSYGNFRSD